MQTSDIHEAAEELSRKHKELSTVTAQNLEAYWHTWLRSGGESIAAKNREAEANTFDLETVAIQLKGEIKALEVEYDYYRTLLTCRQQPLLNRS